MLYMVVMLVMNTSMNKTNMKMCWRVNFTVEMRTSQNKVMAIMTTVVVDQATMDVLMLKVNTSMNKEYEDVLDSEVYLGHKNASKLNDGGQ